MNTQQGSSAGLNTVNYVIFLNISDSAVSACEELPGSQIQSDPPPPSLLRDGENLLNMTLNNPEVEGRVLARLCCSSRVVAYRLVVLWDSSGPDRAMCNCLGGALSCISSLTEVGEVNTNLTV